MAKGATSVSKENCAGFLVRLGVRTGKRVRRSGDEGQRGQQKDREEDLITNDHIGYFLMAGGVDVSTL
jgi:hypothetical protein